MNSKTKAIVVLVTVFLLGGGIGAASTYALARQQDAELYGSDSLEHHDRRRLRAMVRRLDLDEAQAEQVRQILTRHRAERRRLRSELREDCMKPLGDLRARVDEEIEAVLTEQQRERLEQIKKRHPRHHRRHRHNRR